MSDKLPETEENREELKLACQRVDIDKVLFLVTRIDYKKDRAYKAMIKKCVETPIILEIA